MAGKLTECSIAYSIRLNPEHRLLRFFHRILVSSPRQKYATPVGKKIMLKFSLKKNSNNVEKLTIACRHFINLDAAVGIAPGIN